VSQLEGSTRDRKLICARLAVCSSASHLQFVKGTKYHFCIVEWNSPTPVRRQFSLTQEGLGRVIPGGERPGVMDGIMCGD